MTVARTTILEGVELSDLGELKRWRKLVSTHVTCATQMPGA